MGIRVSGDGKATVISPAMGGIRQFLAAAALGLTVLVAGCTSGPVPTWNSAPTTPVVPSPTGSPATPPLPGFSTHNPLPVINHGPRIGHHIALTFDSNMTMGMRDKVVRDKTVSYANLKVLDILEQQHIPATFFLTGLWVEQYPAVTRRIAANPEFELANHTYTDRAYAPDCYNQPPMPKADMASEIVRTNNLLRPYGGHQTDYFRFPGLCRNAAAMAAIASTHVTVIEGDVVSGDPFATAVQPIVTAVLTRAQPGSIVIMHITRDNARLTDQALPPILAGLRQRGLQPVRLSELLDPRPAPATSPTPAAARSDAGLTPEQLPPARLAAAWSRRPDGRLP
jgi:peptidoglycan/xylan/chitin deacetylase (PgdA/CDA1 family)